MKRRNFLVTSTLATGTIFGCSNSQAEKKEYKPTDDEIKFSKAKTAMMTFQRFSWEQGVASHAIIDMADEHTAICMAIGAAKRQQEDGRLGRMSGTSATDPMSCGEVVLYAWKKTGDEFLKNAYEKMLDYAMNKAQRSSDGTIYHFDNRPVIWVDSIYMAPPFLAVSGEYKEAFKQIKGMRNVLFDESTGLYKHQYNDETKKFSRDVYWASGNGWAAAGIARTLLSIPSAENEIMNTLREWLKDHIDACWKYKTQGGFFKDIMDDESSFDESASAAMIAYAIYTAVANSDLPKSYLQKASELRNAVWGKVDEYGYLRDAANLIGFDKPGVSPEAQAMLLMMESARMKNE